jgi:hypothetical protein
MVHDALSGRSARRCREQVAPSVLPKEERPSNSHVFNSAGANASKKEILKRNARGGADS